MELQKQNSVRTLGVIIATILMILTSSLILYPQVNQENILTALRISSLTTAIPFLLVFLAQPLNILNSHLGQWVQTNRLYLWLILTISHLLHLYQIILYYQLGNNCSWIVWLITSPLWLIMIGFSLGEIIKPQLFNQLYQREKNGTIKIAYTLGLWYVWLIFTLAFGLGTIAKHLLFYNLPAFVLFLAAAILSLAMVWRRHS